MNTLCLAAVSGCLFVCPAAFAQEKTDDSEGIGLFDFGDIEKAAREESKKRPEVKKSPLPAEVQTALGTLKNFQELSAAARDEMILRNRDKLAEDLKAAAEKVTAEGTRESMLHEAAAIADSEAGAPLPAPGRTYSAKTMALSGRYDDPVERGKGPTMHPDGTCIYSTGEKGAWRWLDEARGLLTIDWETKVVHLYQITSTSPMTVSSLTNEGKRSVKIKREELKTSYAPVPERDTLLKKAADSERTINAAVVKAVEDRRKQLLEDLRKRSANAGAELANAFSAEAAAVKEHRTESVPHAEKLAGVWNIPGGDERWEFRSDGTLLAAGKPAGTWVWAKAVTQTTVLICLLPQKEYVMGRFSSGGPDTLRMNKFGAEQFTLKLSQ